MPAPNARQEVIEVPLKMVGGTHYGRYPKISLEETWNFIVSDNFLVPYAGYINKLTLSPDSVGRGIYSSTRGNFMAVVIGSVFYVVNSDFDAFNKGSLETFTGDVYISENNENQIAITDGIRLYVYTYASATPETGTFEVGGTDFAFPYQNPGYISFKNGQLIVASQGTTVWALSGFNDAKVWTVDSQHVGSIQTKPDFIQAVVPVPGGGNNVLVFGRNVAEFWQYVGGAFFPYQRNSTANVDYGCINPASIASLNNYIVWIAVNEQSGPVLMVSRGNGIESISTDGIDFKLGNLSAPENCTGFLYQQDGHLLYQFTFPTDNISYAYDFNTNLFSSISDENLNYHIAREVVYYNNTYYFVALNGGNIYEFDSIYPFAQYDEHGLDKRELPRIRICPPLRFPDQRYYITKSLGFTIENGQPNITTEDTITTIVYEDLATEDGDLIATEDGDLIGAGIVSSSSVTTVYTSEAVDLSVSRDGGENFGASVRLNMNATGKRKSRFIWQRLGQANDCTYQIRFYGFGRFVATDGVAEIYK
jgi:hypothetical protein